MADPRGNRPLTDDERTRIRDLHATGATRNDIARALDRSGRTISTACEKMGLTFDRAAVQAATDARKADARARRAALELSLLEDAHRLREQIWQPHTYIDHGGKEYHRVEWEQDEPSPVDKLKLMQAAGIALDRSIKIAEHDKDEDTGTEQALGLLGAVAAGLQAAYDAMTATPADA